MNPVYCFTQFELEMSEGGQQTSTGLYHIGFDKSRGKSNAYILIYLRANKNDRPGSLKSNYK